MSEAINAEEFNPLVIETPNHWASFVNGYHGFWEALFGRTDVHSHNQRITEIFGDAGRKNFINAESGADSGDLAAQAASTVSQQATYTTLLMGHNDVCDADFADIPSDAEFEANVRAALDQYVAGLPRGATVYVIGLVDIYKLWQLGSDLDALGILPCELIWLTSLFELFPCGTMLSPTNSEADRQFTRSRNIAFNQILQDLASEYEANDPHHYYLYTDRVFEADITADLVSDFDCFHPSAKGQKALAQLTWDEGPFALPEPVGALPCGILLLHALRRRTGRPSKEGSE